MSRAIVVGFGFLSVELRWLTKMSYDARGWVPWGIFTGTYESEWKDRYFVIGPLMITFEGVSYLAAPYVRVF